MDKIAIIGANGFVGRAYQKVFSNALLFDPTLENSVSKEEVNTCELAVVCVPTPSLSSGACDTSIVEEVVSWLETPLILIKSALEPGTTDRLKKKYNKRICVSPEFVGESKYWTPPKYPDPTNPVSHGFVILGGDFKDCSKITDFMTPILGPATRFRFVSAIDAEVTKYMENTWAAMKVSFANEMRDICDAVGANWHMVREAWTDDPRVEPFHTAVFKNKRGFNGRCLPKDTKALVHVAEKNGYTPILIKSMVQSNDIRIQNQEGY